MKTFQDLSPTEFILLQSDLRIAMEADDGGLSEARLVRSSSDRYDILFHGVLIGWVVRVSTRWEGYVARRDSLYGRLVGDDETRRRATVEVIWAARR